MSIFEHRDYRSYLKEYISRLPKKGHGELSRIAQHLGVNLALVSQIMSGQKDFTVEQALELCKYLGLKSIEADTFILLVERERAGTHSLKKYYSEKLENLKREGQKIAKRIDKDHQITESEKAVFYSSWIYSAVRIVTSIDEFNTVDAIATRFQISRPQCMEILGFLVAIGLCVEKNGRYAAGPQRTHLEQGSKFVGRHHLNWRMKAMQKAEFLREDELMFTAPFTISREGIEQIREDILQLIQKVSGRVKDSEAEVFYCFNIDLFEVT